MNKKQKKEFSKFMSEIAKNGHKKNPRSRDFYVKMALKRYNKSYPQSKEEIS